MNQKQANDLKRLRDHMVNLPPEEMALIDMNTCNCALPRIEQLGLHAHGLGLDDTYACVPLDDFDSVNEIDWLFSIGFGEPCTYARPCGRDGVEEFADRVETLLQFYGYGD